MTSVDQIISHLDGIDASSFTSEADRLRLADALLGKLRQVQSPWDLAWDHNWVSQATNAAIKILIDAGVFTKWMEQEWKPLTVQDFATLTGAEDVFLRRILRHVAAQHLINEIDEDTYLPTTWAKRLATDPAFPSIYSSFYHEIVVPLFQTLPTFSKETGFKNPTTLEASNFQRCHGEGSTFFGYISSMPHRQRDFSDAMDCHSRGNLTSWPEVYDTNQIVAGAKHDRPLVVDVGGSKGYDLLKFLKKHPETPEGSLILEDLPEVLSSLTIDPAVTPKPYDFFTPQPVKGAKAYYLHIILHDWPDDKAKKILENVAEAMEPGYSRLLLHEAMVSTREPSLQVTTLDLTMMACFSTSERSESEWRSLVDGVDGLQIVKIWKARDTIESIIEIEKV